MLFIFSYASNIALSSSGVSVKSLSIIARILTNKKLLLLLERYQGKSVQLPAHTDVDDSIYGSLATYQKEIVEEFSQWADNHSKEELNSSVETAISTLDKNEQSVYTEAWSSIWTQILDFCISHIENRPAIPLVS